MKLFENTIKALWIGVCAFYPKIAFADVIIEQKGITGIVSHVDGSGIIHLEDGASLSPGIPAKQSYAIKQWALRIEPKALAVLVDGRRISCLYVYELERVIVGDCSASITSFRKSSLISSGGLLSIARNLNIGQAICSSQDQSALVADPSLRPRGISRSDCMKESNNEL